MWPPTCAKTADAWNASIERWIYVSGTDLAKQVGVDGYYVRVSRPIRPMLLRRSRGFVPIKNRPPADSSEPAATIVSPDALALVRFGLRAADDPRILNTIKVIDALLKIETPLGPVWHRYNDDGYGEHEDGSPFDGTGMGRGWPLLAGERGHYELAGGNRSGAESLLEAMEAFANDGGTATGTGLGFRRYSRKRAVVRAAFRFGHAAGLGARRIPEAAALLAGWQGV